MKNFNFIFETPCIVSGQSTGILNLRGIWFLLPSDTMWTVSKRSGYTARCIQAIGGGPHRCVTRYSFNFCTDKRSQELLESQCPGATVVPLIVSTDKTLLTLFGGKMAYLVYMTIGNIPREIRRKPSRHAQMFMGYVPITKFEHIGNKASRHRMLANLFHSCMQILLGPVCYGCSGPPRIA